MDEKELAGLLTFLRTAEQLKNTLRSGYTSNGRQESVAEHTWRLCLMALTLEKYFPEIDFSRLIKMCIIHDLGEIIGGDIPAPMQQKGSKTDAERKDFQKILDPLPAFLKTELLDLWDEYEQAATPEARIAKALDKLETILQHNQGENPDDFNYRYNLDYGKEYTDDDPVIIEIRKILDEETLKRASE